MKKVVSFLLLCVAAAGCLSCDNGEDVNVEKKLVDVCFGVKFVESGSMSRGIAEDTYQDFYNKHIVTKELVKDDYKLTIKDENGNIIAEVNGTWNTTSIQLLTGKYRVTGSSTHNVDFSKVSLTFDEEINVSESETFNLTAQYDCFLLLFPRKDAHYAYYYYDGSYSGSITAMPIIDDLCYMFIREGSLKSKICYYAGFASSQDRVDVTLSNYGEIFQIGNYYYFNIVTGTFTIPPMDNGEI